MRRLYTLLLYLLLPLASAVILVRAVRERDYWRGGAARFGFGSRRAGGGIWVHAVSVGEVQAAATLIAALRQRQPQRPISLTCATPTGRARARTLMPDVDVRYAPYDLPGCVRRALLRLRPTLLIVMETELWPNLLHACARAGIPTLIASARLSQRSARIYHALPGLLRAALASNVWVGAQSSLDAQRFATLGVPEARLAVAGNIKFDRIVAPELAQRSVALRARYAAARPMWIAGSTHEGEESIVLAAHRQVLLQQPQALLVLAPRYPQRCDAVASLVQQHGWQCMRRSHDAVLASAPVLLLDTLGELMDFYAAADVAFVGGSLVGVGGHNLLEPAAVGIPVLSGPQQFNSPDIARALLQHRALTLVHNADELALAVSTLLADAAARERLGANGQAVISANRGALQSLLEMLETLPSAPVTT